MEIRIGIGFGEMFRLQGGWVSLLRSMQTRWTQNGVVVGGVDGGMYDRFHTTVARCAEDAASTTVARSADGVLACWAVAHPGGFGGGALHALPGRGLVCGRREDRGSGWGGHGCRGDGDGGGWASSVGRWEWSKGRRETVQVKTGRAAGVMDATSVMSKCCGRKGVEL